MPMKKRSVLLLSGGIDSTVVGYMLKKEGALYRVVYLKHGKRRNERELLHARRLVRMFGVPLDIGDLSPSRQLIAGYRPDQDDGSEMRADVELPVERVVDGDTTPHDQLNSEKGLSPFSIMLTIGLYYTHMVEADEFNIGLVKQQTLRRPRFKDYLAELARIDHMLNPEIPPVAIAAPLIAMTKGQIIALGTDLGVDFTTTWSCLRWGELHCGTCEHCIQRKGGFREVGIADPTKYEA